MKPLPLLTGLIIGLIAGYVLTSYIPMPSTDPSSSDYETFVSESGAYTFEVPADVVVDCIEFTCYLSSPTGENTQPTPDMTVDVLENNVIFRTWENRDIPYFAHLVNTFAFTETN